MTRRIYIMGAAGSGTTTLGRAVAKAAHLVHVDTDDHFWAPTEPPFTQKRAPQERVASMLQAMGNGDWVLSGSCLGWGEAVTEAANLVVFLSTPNQIRLQRLKAREEQRFGDRIKPGGDMYEIHSGFLRWSNGYEDPEFQGRNRSRHESWLQQQNCTVLRLDGTLTTDVLTRNVLDACD